MQQKRKPLYILTECAIFIALSVILSYFKIPLGIAGGSVDFVMLPLFLLCRRNGVWYGIGSGLLLGLLKCILGGGIGWGLPSVLLDYVLAYGACGLAGLFPRRKGFHELAVLLGCLGRFAVHFVSGITLYAIAVPTEIESIGKTFVNPFLYSLVYNALYMLPNTVLAILAFCLLTRLPQSKKLFF